MRRCSRRVWLLARVVAEELTPAALQPGAGLPFRLRRARPHLVSLCPYRPVRFPHLPEVHALKELFEQTYPTHNYVIEPQSRQYLAHGDLWDHFYPACAHADGGGAERVFLPLTLEMGSWLWVKKNPRQLSSPGQGLFNPRPGHRLAPHPAPPSALAGFPGARRRRVEQRTGCPTAGPTVAPQEAGHGRVVRLAVKHP
jgi:hypothetical protein